MASGTTARVPTTTSSSGKAMRARWNSSPMRPLSTASRLDVRLTLSMPSNTHGVPPIRSSVANAKPCSLPSMRARVLRTQSSLDLERSPIPKDPPIDAISSRSVSVRAVLSFVSTWIAIA